MGGRKGGEVRKLEEGQKVSTLQNTGLNQEIPWGGLFKERFTLYVAFLCPVCLKEIVQPFGL